MNRSANEPDHDPSVEFEPHFAPYLRPGTKPQDPPPPSPGWRGAGGEVTEADSGAASPERGGEIGSSPGTRFITPPHSGEGSRGALGVDPDHSVWDEPTLASALAGEVPADQVTYARWLDERIAATSFTTSVLVTLLLVLCAGPFGVFGAFFNAGAGGGLTAGGLLAVAVIGPITEEITKIALAMWVVERKPYLFKRIWQILLAAAAGGALFGFIENLIYLYVYIPEHTQALADFRWSVCMGLHVNCSFVAGVGLARMWDHAIRNRVRPELGKALPWFAVAMGGHGLYNLTVTVAEMTGMLALD